MQSIFADIDGKSFVAEVHDKARNTGTKPAGLIDLSKDVMASLSDTDRTRQGY